MSQEENKETKPNYTYALLQETCADDGESHYVFIRYQGNEDNLKHLAKQLNLIKDWDIDEGSVFDLELDYLVSEQTAKEMTKVDINSYFHRKYNGKLKKVSLGFRDHESDRKKIRKLHEILGNGGITEYLSDEDLDPDELEELMNQSDSDEDSEDEEDSASERSHASPVSPVSHTSEKERGGSSPISPRVEKIEKVEKKEGKLPGTKKVEIPRYAKVKQRDRDRKKKKRD